MRRIRLLLTIIFLGVTLPLVARPQQQAPLGDVARQLRQQDKDAKKATKVFTNDNLPAPKPMEAVTRMSAPPESLPSTAEASAKTATSRGAAENKSSEPADDKAKTRDYWQDKFRAARQDLARAKEQQQLAEDELNLLEIQQAREMDPLAKQDLDSRVQAKQSEVDAAKAEVEAAQKNLEDLAKDFDESGAPSDWSQTEQNQGQGPPGSGL